MTRKKKSRSLKRIHQVKTGNKSKLKKAANTNRQNQLNGKKRTKSAYEKYLEQNPEVAQAEAKKQTQLNNKNQREQQAVVDAQQAEQQKAEQKSAKQAEEKDPDLLGQLDNKTFDDMY